MTLLLDQLITKLMKKNKMNNTVNRIRAVTNKVLQKVGLT